ncbi:MAG: nucleoside triphosphate pyrophosphohydrolase [Lysobacterales bacterium]
MRTIEELLAIMAQLRDRDHGCPWDAVQTFDTIAPYTIEEAYEVADAIDRRDHDALRDELGDLLLQVVFHSRMAEEEGRFAFGDVVDAIAGKLVARHPHVFGGAGPMSLAEQSESWHDLKARERARCGDTDRSALAGITRGLPEWARALKLQQRAARVGFDWPGPRPVLDKLAEEAVELQAEFDGGRDAERLLDEIGDVLFVCVNLARHAGVDPSRALRSANAKFERRFRRMEVLAAEAGTPLAGLPLDAQEAFWQRVKAEERGG